MKKLLSLAVIFGVLFPLHAQNFVMDGTDFDTCEGYFQDSGGDALNYLPGEDFTTTICSDNAPGNGTHIRLTFANGVDISPGDELCFYDGENTDSLLACHFEFQQGAPFIIQATATNPSGCITVTFTSDSDTLTGEGWNASISCQASCQIVNSVLTNSTPAVMPADTGWIDICPGDRVLLYGEGFYPQSGQVYDQSDQTSSFEWDLGDGNIDYGPVVSHTYNEPGGYIIELRITDVAGCRSTNFLRQRVRVAPEPTFLISDALPEQICTGDTISLNSMVNDTSSTFNVSVLPNPDTFNVIGIRSDSLALPDGVGVAYESSVSFTEFQPGQTLQNINDLLGICVIMEHSWMRDLEIGITCPNGTSIILHDHPGQSGGEVFLGIPNENDEGLADPIPGTGFEYCWTQDATAGTWIEYANNFNPNTLPSGDYNSFQPLSDLIGCPLNGEWTISVEDLWGIDNGFIFSWSILFDPSLYPEVEVFLPVIDSSGWRDNPSIFFSNGDSIAAAPPNAGIAGYVFEVFDEYGCVHDTTLSVEVLPFTHPDCFSCGEDIDFLPDTSICVGDSVQIDASALVEFTSPPTTFESYPNYAIGNANHPHQNPYEADLTINSLFPTTITNATEQICGVCLNLETDFDADINLRLRAPNGQLLELSTANGGAGDNYTNTCFTTDALTPITAGTAPFTGNFQPEGNWNVLNGAPVNGEWTLLVSDGFGLNDMGILRSWSICFNTENNATFSWSPMSGLSCTDCPDPVVAPSSSSTYFVQAQDLYNCIRTDSINIGVFDLFPAPQIDCSVTDTNQITFVWDALPGVTEYEVNINSMGWMPPNGINNHVINGLGLGETADIEVRAIAPSGNCPAEVGVGSCTNLTNCPLAGGVLSTDPPSCNDSADGSITLFTTGALGNITFALNGQNPQSDSIFSDLASGDYFVVINDDFGCVDTIDVTLTNPDTISITLTPDSVSCFAGLDGAVTSIVTGGTAGYAYSWEGEQGFSDDQADIGGLIAGDYCLTVTDANGCTAEACTTVEAPEAIELSSSFNPPSCYNSSDGSASVVATGGAAGYTYLWNDANGQNTATAIDLAAGVYEVTVEDAEGCLVVDTVSVTAPDAVVIQSFSLTPPSCFEGTDGQVMVSTSGGTGSYTYSWDDPAGQTTNPAVDLGAGVYSVTVTDTDGCTAISSASIMEPTAIQVSSEVDNVSCFGGEDGAIVVNPSGGTPGYDFNWSVISVDSFVTGLSAGNYFLTMTDANGCTFTTNIAITEPPTAVEVDAEQTVTGCFGEEQGVAEAMASGGVGGYEYEWSNGQVSATADELGAQWYTISITDANGCMAVDSLLIEEFNPINASFNIAEPTCFEGVDGQIEVESVNGGGGVGDISNYTFEWATNPAQTGVLVTNLPGNATYSVTITDNFGCTEELKLEMDEPSPITLQTAIEPVSCFDGGDGTATIVPFGDNDTFFFAWDAASGNQTTATANDLEQGTYFVTVTDIDGCEADTFVTINQPTAINMNFLTIDNDCHYLSTGEIEVLPGGGTPNYSYFWSDGRSVQTIDALSNGKYIVTVTDANGCTSVDSAYVSSPPPINTSLLTEPVSCFGDEDGSIEIEPQGGTPPYLFSTDGQEFNGIRRIVALSTSTYNVFVQDAKGCIWQGQAAVGGPDAPVEVDLGPDLTIELGDSIQLGFEVTNAQGEYFYFWGAPYTGTLSCPDCEGCPDEELDCESPWAQPEYTLFYDIEVEDELGCFATDQIRVSVEKDRSIYVPTGFTPNNDGVNDLLLVHGESGTTVTLFRVYDRWGELVFETGDFETNDPTVGWDGNFKGKTMNPGVYVWYVEVEYIDGKKASFKGHSTLLK